MGKFNREFGKDLKAFAASTEATGGESVKVGAGLLNDASKGNKMKIIYVQREEIDKNARNEYSIEGIESLAWSIKTLGLLQPLQLSRKEDGRYKLIGGERRLTAIDRLIADENVEEWNKESLIPGILKDPQDVKLPLNEELKEIYCIMAPNKEARKYTDADKLMELRYWKEIIQALREQGVQSIPGVDEEGNEQEIAIQGEKTRDILAKTTGMSRGMVNKYEKVENQGSDALKDALLNNSISIGTAETMVDHLEEEKQDELIQEAENMGKKITEQDILQKKKSLKEEDTEPHAGTKLTSSDLNRDMKPLIKLLDANNIYLDEDEKLRYYNSIREIEKLLKSKKNGE